MKTPLLCHILQFLWYILPQYILYTAYQGFLIDKWTVEEGHGQLWLLCSLVLKLPLSFKGSCGDLSIYVSC